MPDNRPEFWLRGPVEGVPGLLQPVAHALLQAREDLERTLAELPPSLLWKKVGEAASIGFHVRHATGSLDRLLSYARGEALSGAQSEALRREKQDPEQPRAAGDLMDAFSITVDRAVGQLRATAEADLLAPRKVGRAGLPSTVIGLLVHAAEHTQRHVGQIITTARIARSSPTMID